MNALNALNEKVNAEFGSRPFNRMAFNQMLVSMGRWLYEMFPESHVPEITGSYVIETGVVDLPNLVPVIEKLVQERKEQESRTLHPTKGDTAPMSQPITETDVAEYLTKYIQTSELVPDAMKAMFIGRVTNWQNTVVQQGEQVPLRREMCPGFGWALEKLQQGNKVRRAGWNGAQMWLQLQRPDQYSKMTLPYIYMEYPKGHIAHPDGCRIPWLASQSDMLSYDWQIVSEMPVPISAPSASVARMSDTAAPLPMTIIKDDDGSFFIAIGDRKWKICRPGIIGITERDRWDFNAAARKLSGCDLSFSDDTEVTLPYCRQSYLEGKESEYKRLLKSRGTEDTSLGQIAYECFRSSGEVLGAESAPPWSDIPKDGPVCAAWEFVGRACYYSVGTWPDDAEKTIQMLATRKRLQLLRETGRFQVKEGTELASFLNLVAGPPVERKA